MPRRSRLPAEDGGEPPSPTLGTPAPLPAPRPAVPDWSYEAAAQAAGYRAIAGGDEVGRGAWVGPLVAAAVMFPPALVQAATGRPDPEQAAALAELAPVRDSKQLTAAARQALDAVIRRHAAVGLGWVSAALCDRIGMAAANRLALTRAIRALPGRPEYLLLDAFRLPSLPIPQLALIKGDSRVVSIAAASIVAKVARDALLEEYDTRWPGYGFAQNKGYGTAGHAAALQRGGPCPEHRRSFTPVRTLYTAGPTP